MWEWFCGLLETALELIVGICGDWGLAIIILTVLIRLILLPFSIKQTASTTRLSLMSGQLQELQKRYEDDPQRLAEETRKFYTENNVNPVAGCLPVILQMPIFFALFTVLRGVSADARFYNILPTLASSASSVTSEEGFAAASVYIAIVLLFGFLTFIPMLLSQTNTNPEQAAQTRMMSGIMALVMIYAGWSIPAGVILYYVTSSAWGVIQQLVITKRVKDKVYAEEAARAAEGPIQVDVMRRERKKRPHKKS